MQPRHVWSSSATAVVVGLAAVIFLRCRIGLFICGEHGRRSFHDLVLMIRPFWSYCGVLPGRCPCGRSRRRPSPPAADLSTQSLPKPLEVPVMTMVRGTLASYGGVTSWPTLGSPSPRPNPQDLLVVPATF